MRQICFPVRLSGKRGDELLLLIVVDDYQHVVEQSRRSSGAEIEVHGIRFERGVPRLRTFQIVSPHPETGDINVDELAIRGRRFRNEAILAMPPARRMPRVEFALPFFFAGVEVQAIEEIMQRDFSGHLDIARVDFLHHLFFTEALLGQLGNVFIAVLGSGLRLLRFSVRDHGGEKYFFP